MTTVYITDYRTFLVIFTYFYTNYSNDNNIDYRSNHNNENDNNNNNIEINDINSNLFSINDNGKHTDNEKRDSRYTVKTI